MKGVRKAAIEAIQTAARLEEFDSVVNSENAPSLEVNIYLEDRFLLRRTLPLSLTLSLKGRGDRARLPSP